MKRKEDRGQYRPIRIVLLDGPDYQQLPAPARLLFLTLKLKLGPAGIAAMPGMVPALCELTGLSELRVTEGLALLAHHNWIRYEKNILWVVDGLKHEPSLSFKNEKHRQSVQEYLAGLPRLSIVELFKGYYNWWLAGDESLPHIELTDPPPLPPTLKAETPQPAKEKKPPTSWVGEGAGWWEANVGAVGYSRFGKTLKPFVDRYTWERVFAALQAYVQEAQEAGKTAIRVEWFAAEAVARLERRTDERKLLPSQVKPWEIEKHDADLARQPHVHPTVLAYKKSLPKGEEWWEQMKREAKTKGRHALVYAYEQVLTFRSKHADDGSAGDDRSAAPEAESA